MMEREFCSFCSHCAKLQKISEILTWPICFFTIFANENYNEFINKKIGGIIMKQTREAFEAKNLEYENLYNEEDERRDYNSIWYN